MRKTILPLSTPSFAPVTNQWPGISWGPLDISVKSTIFASFPALVELSSFLSSEVLVLEDDEAPSDLNGVAGVEGLWSQTDRRIVQPGTFENRSFKYSTFLAPKSQTPSCAPVTMWTPDKSPMLASVYSMGAVLTCEKFFHLIGSNHLLSCSSGPCHFGAPMATCESQWGWRIFGRDTRCWRWIASRFCLQPSRLSLRPVTGLRPTVICNNNMTWWMREWHRVCFVLDITNSIDKIHLLPDLFLLLSATQEFNTKGGTEPNKYCSRLRQMAYNSVSSVDSFKDPFARLYKRKDLSITKLRNTTICRTLQ